MMKKILFFFLCSFLCGLVQGQSLFLIPKKGMVIKKSVRIKPATYQWNAVSADTPVLVIEGNNIVVDFSGSQLVGSLDKQNPDEFYGVAILVRNGKNIRIKNLSAKGYKVALIARNVDGLVIENCNFSYNYRQHLNSTQL